MTRKDWSADTSWDEVKARARGRRRWNTTQRYRAQARRVQVDKRLTVLRREAWDQGLTGWVPRGVVAQLAAEFGVDKSVIFKDIKIINRWPDPTPPPPRQRLKDPRWGWAYSRP